jgi:hypothetical protein
VKSEMNPRWITVLAGLAGMLGACASSAAIVGPTSSPAVSTASPAPPTVDVQGPDQVVKAAAVAPSQTGHADSTDKAEANDGTESVLAISDLTQTCESNRGGESCSAPPSVVKKLCERASSPETALYMFQKDSPWKRIYVNRDLDAWYAGGHAACGHSAKSTLTLDEEVIVLSHGANGSGVMVGSGGFDVMRWNGSCVSVSPEEVSKKPPRTPTRANIPWQILDNKVRDALLADETIAAADKNRRKICRDDIMSGTKSTRCAKATDALSRAVAEAIGKGRVSVAPALGLTKLDGRAPVSMTTAPSR